MSSSNDKLPEPATALRSETMGGLAKGLAIIEMFSAGYTQLTIAEASRGADTSRAAARRCLLTLIELGYLEHDGKFYRPKPRLRRLGGRSAETGGLAELANPILARACDEINESLSLAVLDGRSSLFIARAAASRVVSTGVHVGDKLPGYCSATGRLLLGTLEDDEIRLYLKNADIVQRTKHTVTDPRLLFKRITDTRTTGVSFSDEELELGMRAMAVPVFNRNDEVVAAMSLSTYSRRVSLETMKKQYLPVLQKAAQALTRTLKTNNEHDRNT